MNTMLRVILLLTGASALISCGETEQETIRRETAGQALTLLDCPMRDDPYSVESPLIDVLLNPAAREALESRFPGMDEQRWQWVLGTETPSFAAILTPRMFADWMGQSEAAVESLQRELSRLPVTDEDRRLRCRRYDADIPQFNLPDAPVSLLVFSKINGYDHGPSVTAATEAVSALAAERGWAVAVTDRGGAFNPTTLARFDAVIWNNVSGDVLTLSQRRAFRDYIEQGGGFVGLHGSGGDSLWFWGWYADELLRARFIGHPDDPQFQDARVVRQPAATRIGADLPRRWTMNDEWYSFEDSPRLSGVNVLATLDESTYIPEMAARDLRMGDDHPIAWTHCVGEGRSFYSAIGHRPEVYEDENYQRLLGAGLSWAAGQGHGNGSNTCAE